MDEQDKRLVEETREAARRTWEELCAGMTPEQKRLLYRWELLGLAPRLLRVAREGAGPMTLAEVRKWLGEVVAVED